jgi:hypothetical protein
MKDLVHLGGGGGGNLGLEFGAAARAGGAGCHRRFLLGHTDKHEISLKFFSEPATQTHQSHVKTHGSGGRWWSIAWWQSMN